MLIALDSENVLWTFGYYLTIIESARAYSCGKRSSTRQGSTRQGNTSRRMASAKRNYSVEFGLIGLKSLVLSMTNVSRVQTVSMIRWGNTMSLSTCCTR